MLRNCIIENNEKAGIHFYLRALTSKSEDISILVENCLIRGSGTDGIHLGAVCDNGPQGVIEFKNCLIEDTVRTGAHVFDKSSKSAAVRFVNCKWNKPFPNWNINFNSRINYI